MTGSDPVKTRLLKSIRLCLSAGDGCQHGCVKMGTDIGPRHGCVKHRKASTVCVGPQCAASAAFNGADSARRASCCRAGELGAAGKAHASEAVTGGPGRPAPARGAACCRAEALVLRMEHARQRQ